LVLLHVAKRPPLAQRLSSACGQAASAQRRTRAQRWRRPKCASREPLLGAAV